MTMRNHISAPEETLAFQIRACKLPRPEREYRWHATRRWRADFAFLAERVLIEVEGGVWSNGRHTRGKGFIADVEKYNEAALSGWLLIRVTPEQIKSGQAMEWIKRALVPARIAA